MKRNNIYPAVFKKEEEGGYSVHFPDLPGCITQGDSIFEAFKYAKEVLALYLDGEEGVPAPSDIDSVECPENGRVMLVEADKDVEIEYTSRGDLQQIMMDALQDHGMTKYRAAKALGVSEGFFGRVTRGERRPSADMAKRIAALLDLDWRVFFG